MGSRVKPLAVAAFAAAFAAGTATAAPPYTITELKPLRGSVSYVTDVNLAGQATGVMTDESGTSFAYRGFFYDPRTGLVDVGDLGGANTFAVAINNAGVVTGSSQTDSGRAHAFVYTPGVGMRDLGGGPGGRSFASDIGESGNVVGNLAPGDRAFHWSQSGGMRDLGAASMLAFNHQGDAFGSRARVPGMWKPPYNTFAPFGPVPAGFTGGEAGDGNVFGHSVGTFSAGGTGATAFYWDGRAYRTLRPAGTRDSTGKSINDAGDVVVNATDSNRSAAPYLYRQASAEPVRSAALNPPGSPFSSLVEFSSLDDIGHIGGAGLAGGNLHGFVLTPPFEIQVDTLRPILQAGVPPTSPFRLLVERGLQRVTGADATSCFQLRELARSLSVAVGVPFTQPQREVGQIVISAILAANGCATALPNVPVTIPHVFTRRGEREGFAVTITAAKPVTILAEFPRGSRFDVVGVRETPRKLKLKKTRTKTSVKVRVSNVRPGVLSFAVVAKKLVGRATPVIAEVS